MLVTATAALLAGCGTATEPAAPAPSALVGLARAEVGSVRGGEALYGAVEAGTGQRIDLPAPLEASVAAILTPVGTRVSAGQPVARLVASPVAQADLARASADAATATAALARAQRLRADGLASDADVEAARAAARTAAATRASVTTRLNGLVLRAPRPGFVQAVNASPGALVVAGTSILSLSPIGPTRARFGITPDAARAVRPGQPLSVKGPDGMIAGTVASVDPTVDPQTRMAALFVDLPTGIAAGVPVTADLASASGGTTGIIIPYAAVLDDAGQPFAYVVAGGIAHRRDLVLGDQNGDRVAVGRGIRAGERVVVRGGTGVEDGMRVRTR
ncbi:efflux RND transporter periplasmic adaptor subunit [Sphingomonas donggukensis]|uniref:Efflux RND transporter periplasmic adaptor subunit n=1 Tax=Sphingomonas donggukensis TaxID=2949093 RepID=A0ABY4TX73_9SPHN|nr:efflux RND transporter periplasmic adaptor subunit [Sphingomonas donggukensis]URW77010.1 efflux RND transporter periplasmic adaptor subunit [Sphingomonas donggukensis]